MAKKLSIPIGVDDYKEIITRDSVYIDKTLLIKEFWEDGSGIVLTPRPRRFGKTLNLSMLKYFFEHSEESNAYLFKKTNIWKYPEYQKLQGQFPVLFLTFKDIKVNTWAEAYQEFKDLLALEIERVIDPACTVLTVRERQWYDAILMQTATLTDYKNSLLFATKILERFYKKKIIVLIDEYDSPITHAYLKGYYPKMLDFMRGLLSKVLKTNPALSRAFLTGVMRTAKEGMLSGLNNLAVHTVLSNDYSDKFGFTQEEVDSLISQYQQEEHQEAIRAWYNGYSFGENKIYNPWSVLYCIKENGLLKPYWVNTSDNELVERLIAQASDDIKSELELLLEGKTLKDKEIDEGVILLSLDTEQQEPWSFLLFTGYLTAVSRVFRNKKQLYTLAVPNEEIAILYKDLVLKAISKVLSFSKLKKLFEALMTGDVAKVSTLLQEYVSNTCSSHDLPKNDVERSIHMFVLGLLAQLSDRYIVQSNRESGDGRYDIMLMPRSHNDIGVIIEFKKTKTSKQSTLEKTAILALEQIKARDYEQQLRTFGYHGNIFCYGIAVCGKHLVAKIETIFEIKH